MKFSKFIVIPVMIAVLAALLQVIDQWLGQLGYFAIATKGFAWLSFQAWALYFLAGCTLGGGLRVMLGYVSGIVGSIAIIAFAGWLGGQGLGFWAVPLSLLILVIPVICLERVRWFDMVPAIFIAAGGYFCIMNYVPGATFCNAAVTEFAFCLIGLLFGWVTVALRVGYEKCVAKKKGGK